MKKSGFRIKRTKNLVTSYTIFLRSTFFLELPESNELSEFTDGNVRQRGLLQKICILYFFAFLLSVHIKMLQMSYSGNLLQILDWIFQLVFIRIRNQKLIKGYLFFLASKTYTSWNYLSKRLLSLFQRMILVFCAH